MKTERINVLQFKKERDRGIITGNNLKQYVFSLRDVTPAVVNQLTRGIEVEFTVLEDKSPSLIKINDLKIITHQENKYEKSGPKGYQREKVTSSSADRGGNKQAKDDATNKPFPQYLPKDTRETIKNGGAAEISNYDLMLNKYPLVQDNKFYFYRVDSRTRQVIYNYNHDFPQIDFQMLVARKEKAIKGLGILTQRLVMEPEWRMVIGLGGASVYETSLTLHHTYGIPYIPGSALKGVTRSWIIAHCFENNESKALKDKGFELIFGSNENKSKVVFYDAFPQEKPKIVVDVMTPHYSDYYSKGRAPGDYGSPNPIPFITVEKTKFNFIVGIDALDNVIIDKGCFEGRMVLDVVKEWLNKALSEHGIGAKTAVGYGIMKM